MYATGQLAVKYVYKLLYIGLVSTSTDHEAFIFRTSVPEIVNIHYMTTDPRVNAPGVKLEAKKLDLSR